MQSNQIKLNSNEQDNTNTDQNSPENQTQDETKNVYHASQIPQHNTPYLPKLIDSFDYVTLDAMQYEQPPPPYSSLSIFVLPMKHLSENNQMVTAMISNLRKFLLISSIIYFIWGILAVSLTIMLTMLCSPTLYYGLWAGNLLVNAALNISIIVLWTSNAMTHLIRMLFFGIFFCTIGCILLAINYTTSKICIYTTDYSCISNFISNLQLAFVFIFILAALHNVINLVATYNVRNNTLQTFSTRIV